MVWNGESFGTITAPYSSISRAIGVVCVERGLGLVGVARADDAEAHHHHQVAVALLVHGPGQADRAAGAVEVEHLGAGGDVVVLHHLRGGAGGDVVAAAGGVGDHDPQVGQRLAGVGGVAADAGKPMTDLRFDGPEHAGRRLRHHRPGRREGDGGRRHHPRHRGLQPRRRRRHGRPGPHREREGQRRPGHDDGARRGRRELHEQVPGHAQGDDPDRPAHRGVRRRDGVEGLAVQDHRRPGHRLEEGPQGDQRRRWLLAGRPDHLLPMQLPRPSGSTPAT